MANVIVCSPTRALRLIHRLVVVLVAVGGFAVGAAAQTTVTLSTPGTHINADLTIQGGGYAHADFSASDALASKASSDSYTRRILLKIDTQNTIPANAVIQSAQLYLVLKTSGSSETRPLSAYYVNKSFQTGETTWSNYQNGLLWSQPGGDLGTSFGTTNVGNAVGSAYKFDLTKLVQAAVNGQLGSSRYTRVALVDTGGDSGGSYKEFHSTRSATVSLRPRLVVTYGTSPVTPSAPPPPPPVSSPTGTTLRVMQWNIHKTKGSDGRCSPDHIASGIAAQNVQVVSLNEVNFFSGECAYTFDMGEKLQSLLQQKTGATWYRQNVNAGGVGNVLLSRYRPVSSGYHLLSNGRGVAQMTIVVNGRNVNVFSIHIEYYNSSWRPAQIAEGVSYMNNFSEPRIMMGDFNTWPGTADYGIIAKAFGDAWAAAKSAGTSSAYNGTGATHGDSRFDYAFYSKVATLALQSVKVPDMRVNGVSTSDHAPVISTFAVQ